MNNTNMKKAVIDQIILWIVLFTIFVSFLFFIISQIILKLNELLCHLKFNYLQKYDIIILDKSINWGVNYEKNYFGFIYIIINCM